MGTYFNKYNAERLLRRAHIVLFLKQFGTLFFPVSLMVVNPGSVARDSTALAPRVVTDDAQAPDVTYQLSKRS